METNKSALTARNFPTAEEEAAAAAEPSRYAGPESAYRLAFTDTEFLLREELRPVRMQLELLKPEMMQQEQGIESTIVIFGSARITTPEDGPADGRRRATPPTGVISVYVRHSRSRLSRHPSPTAPPARGRSRKPWNSR